MGTGITILLVFIAVVVTLLIAVPVTRKIAVDHKIRQDAEKIGTAEEKARNIIDEALKTAETKKREALLEAKEEPTWAFAIKERFEESIEEAVHSDAFPMKPQRIVADIRKALSDPEDILISDVGAHKMWIGRLYGCYKPETCIISNGFASMGIGVPGAVAAKLVYPERRVLVATGDGGFMMNSQELETAVRLGVNFVVVIFHDSEYGLIKWKEEEQYGRAAFVDFTNPDFVALAEAMHCNGVRVNSAEELGEAIRKGFEEKVPVIIDTPVDYSANEELSAELRSL